MKNAIIAGLLIGAAHGMTVPVLADDSKITKGYYTIDAMGCMLVQDCTDNVRRIKNIDDIRADYPDSDYDLIADEFNSLARSLTKVGVKIFLAPSKYFPVGHRGVYHTVGNNFFLNEAYMHRQGTLMSVMRHEGWHAAQDCMAGTIKNSMIAIIMDEEKVPPMYQELVRRTYADTPHAIPWEKEAYWAGKTAGMTADALDSCARGTMWTDYEPTPMTREWLEAEGYIK